VGGTSTNSYGVYGTTATVTAGTITRNYASGFSGWSVLVGNVGIGTGLSSAYVTTQNPTAGTMIVEGNVGIGTYVTNAGKLQVGTTDHSGNTACIGTNNCLGYCSGALLAVCGTCTCL
jgi:hypothetical protein